MTLGVGSSVQITLKLGVAAVSENVTVTGHGPTVEGNTLPPAVNKETPEVSNTLAGLTVTYLPNRDRDFSQFGQLAAGVQSFSQLCRTDCRRSAARWLAVAVDGADFNDPLQGGERGAHDNAFFFPQTVVREFQVVHAGATAEVGGTNAGFVNIVTKEGSNKYHGEAFYIGRPSALTSSDAFGHSLDNAQNEFGGSLGGPIKRNRAFFYVGAEQDYLNIPYWTEFEAQPPGIVIPPALAALQQQIVGKSDPTAVFARADVLLNTANTLNLQFNFNHVHATNIDDGSTRSIAPIDNSALLTGESYWVRGSLTTLFGSRKVNQFLAQWAQDQRHIAPNATTPEAVINGFGVLGGNSLANQSYTSKINRINDDFAITMGAATLHLGGDFAYDPARERHEANLNGRFDFDSLADFLDNDPRRFQQTFVLGNDVYSGAVRELGLYVNAKLPVTKISHDHGWAALGRAVESAAQECQPCNSANDVHSERSFPMAATVGRGLESWRQDGSQGIYGFIRCAYSSDLLPARVHRQRRQHGRCRQLLRSADSVAGFEQRPRAGFAAGRVDYPGCAGRRYRSKFP